MAAGRSHAIGGDAGGYDDPLDAQIAGGLEDVIGRGDVITECFGSRGHIRIVEGAKVDNSPGPLYRPGRDLRIS